MRAKLSLSLPFPVDFTRSTEMLRSGYQRPLLQGVGGDCRDGGQYSQQGAWLPWTESHGSQWHCWSFQVSQHLWIEFNSSQYLAYLFKVRQILKQRTRWDDRGLTRRASLSGSTRCLQHSLWVGPAHTAPKQLYPTARLHLSPMLSES